jgi:hypothetical protein
MYNLVTALIAAGSGVRAFVDVEADLAANLLEEALVDDDPALGAISTHL